MNTEKLIKLKKLLTIAGVFGISFFSGMKIREVQEKIVELSKRLEESENGLFSIKKANDEALAFAIEEKKQKDQYCEMGKQYMELYGVAEDFDPEELLNVTNQDWNSFLFNIEDVDLEKLLEKQNNMDRLELFDYVSFESSLAEVKDSENLEEESQETSIVEEEQETLEEITEVPREGEISSTEIDFTRIATSKKKALAENFLSESSINREYWDNATLIYEIEEDDTVAIYKGENLFAYTDIQGLKLDGEIAPIETPEEVTLASSEEEHISENEFVLDADVQIEATEEIEDYVWEYIDEATSLLSMQTVPDIPRIVGEDNFEIKPGYHKTYYNKTYDFTEEENSLLGFVVEYEARGGSYEDALGTVSIILNRLENPKYSTDLTGVLTAPGQFEVYSENAYASYVSSGKQAPEYVQKAIEHATQYGIRNLDYLSWKASYTEYDKNEPNLNERRYKMVSGGNIYHNLAKSVARTELLENQESVNSIEESLDQEAKAKVYSYPK